MTPRPLWLIALACSTAVAHSQATRRTPAPRPPRPISFVSPTPVLGLPSSVTSTTGVCSADGLSFFDTSAGTDTPVDLYTVSTTAEVKHLRRKLPDSYTDLTVMSFYPGDHTLVTLLKAEKRDDPKSSANVTDYYLSVSDHDGDQADLLQLRLPFKPLNIGVFGGGDFLAIGWETANQLPVMAVLKPDGTIRRYIDMVELQGPGANVAANLELLESATFVPSGDNVLLTYPKSTRPMQLVLSYGLGQKISLSIPTGYVLHDVLNYGGVSFPVFRVEPIPQPPEEKGKAAKPGPIRIFEVNPFTGIPREFLFDQAPPSSVTCAAKASLIAVFLSAVGASAKGATTAADAPTEVPTQLFVGSVRR